MNKLLSRSAELEKILLQNLNMNLSSDIQRNKVSKILAIVSFEHAESLKMLLSLGNFTSSIGMLRLQYESFVRSLWIYYSASDTAVSKLLQELTADSAKKAQKMPILSEMLKQLEDKAPTIILEQIIEFKEYHWKPLNSYVHGGIHAIQRRSQGYPVQLLTQILKTSNGLAMMVTMFLIMIDNDSSKTGVMPIIQKNFRDCLPNEKIK